MQPLDGERVCLTKSWKRSNSFSSDKHIQLHLRLRLPIGLIQFAHISSQFQPQEVWPGLLLVVSVPQWDLDTGLFNTYSGFTITVSSHKKLPSIFIEPRFQPGCLCAGDQGCLDFSTFSLKKSGFLSNLISLVMQISLDPGSLIQASLISSGQL